MEVVKTSPISYCSGVAKAISKAKQIRKEYPDRNIYFFGDLVHNQLVIDGFNKIDIKIISFNKDNGLEKLDKLNEDDIVIFSAHGHDKKYEEFLKKKGILFFDTTCDKVYKILNQISNTEKEIIYIGKKNHPECEASLSYSKNIRFYNINEEFDFSLVQTDDPIVINQSTLSVLELKEIFDKIKENVAKPHFFDEICDATRVRQSNILSLDDSFDLVVVVGDKKSSNSTKLYELALKNKNVFSIMVNSLDEIKKYDLSKYKKAYVTSGTSTPIEIVNKIIMYLKEV